MKSTQGTRLVAFVHLGETKPKHLFPNMRRVRNQTRNAGIEVVLIGTSQELLREAINQGFQAMQYDTAPEVESLLSDHEKVFDHDFRRGFWRFSIERLFALASIFDQIEEARVLHIESDILTFTNFPFETIFGLEDSTWAKLNEVTDVGSLIYLPSREKSKLFRSRLVEVLTQEISLTDMTALSRLGMRDPRVRYFPIAESSTSEYLNFSNLSYASSKRMTDLYSNFNGIFDSAPIGMFELGQDPRNNWGMIRRGIKLEHSGVFAERYKLVLSNEGTLATSKGIEVFCLHVHSKEVKLFEEDGEKFLQRRLKKKNSKFGKISFSFAAFSEMLRDYRERGKLFVLLMNFPPIKKSRQFELVENLENWFRRKR